MKYLDLVELIKEKPAYTKAGVKVGDFGAIMSEKAINGKWQVIFSEFLIPKSTPVITFVFTLKILPTILFISSK